MLFAAGTVTAITVLVHRYDAAVPKAVLLDSGARGRQAGTGGVLAPNPVSGPLNYLLVGSDARDAVPAMGERSDTIIIVHVPVSMDSAYLISIPRDLRVAIPPDPARRFGGGTAKINAAFNYGGGGTGGVRLLSRTLAALTGIRFDGAAVVNFSGFNRVVQLLGGVTLCVDETTRSIHTGMVYRPGCQHLHGSQALDYVRQRETLPGGDFDRQRHQQQFLKALFAAAMNRGMTTNPLKLDRLIRAAGHALTVDTNGVPLDELVFSLRSITPSTLSGIRLPAYPAMIGGTSYVLADRLAGSLYRALAADTLAGWLAGNRTWRNPL